MIRAATLHAFAGAVSLAACSCSRTSPAERSDTQAEHNLPAPVASGPSLVHPTGLTLGARPPEYAVGETETGFRIEPANARRLRNPWSIQLLLADVDPLSGPDLERKKTGDRDVHYRVDVDDAAGSGGPLHTLSASTSCGAKHIVMSATQQAEPPGQPDWGPAWEMLGWSGCEMGR